MNTTSRFAFGKVPRSALAKSSGLSLVEILISFGIFSAGIAGLLLASQGMFEALRLSMTRDIEASYVNMLMLEINPNNPSIETAYDVNTRTAFDLPNNDRVFYTRLVNSSDATPDIKNINVYLYRSTTATTPFRQFRREVAPYFIGFDLGQETSYFKDSLGRIWEPLAANYFAVGTAGSRRNGIANALSMTNYPTSTCGFTGTNSLLNSLQEANNAQNRLEYTFYTTVGRNYILRLGTTEREAGVTADQRSMVISVNGTQVGTMDARSETGATCQPLNKSYVVTPVDAGGGVGTITVRIDQGSSATLPPRMGYVGLERTEFTTGSS
jgi:Tfp pilus assembly protein PilV